MEMAAPPSKLGELVDSISLMHLRLFVNSSNCLAISHEHIKPVRPSRPDRFSFLPAILSLLCTVQKNTFDLYMQFVDNIVTFWIIILLFDGRSNCKDYV